MMTAAKKAALMARVINAELGYKAGHRLRELAPRQQAGFTQPGAQLTANLCREEESQKLLNTVFLSAIVRGVRPSVRRHGMNE